MNDNLDRGLLLGDALFETVLLCEGRPFRLDRHLERLREGAARCGIPLPSGLPDRLDRDLRGAGRDAEERRVPWEAVRITLTRGPGAGLAPPSDPTPHLHITRRRVRRLPPDRRPALQAIRAGRVAEQALSAGLKTTGYMERILALRAAERAGADEALLLNSAGRPVEGTASNLFLVRDGVLHTPSVNEGALPGITRGALLELAEVHGIECRVGDAPEPERCDEAFLTSSLRGPISLVGLDGTPIGDGSRPVFGRLAGALEELVWNETADSPRPGDAC